MPKSTGRRRRNRRAKRSRRSKTTSSHPPALTGTELKHHVALRFTAVAAASSTSISWRNLLDTLLVATTATAGTNLFEFVKIRAIRVWGIGALGTPTTVIVRFSGASTGLVGDNEYHADTSMGIEPAMVYAKPAAKSLASNYQVSSVSEAFTITCPAGSVVDVLLSFRSQFSAVNATAAVALSGATAGQQYLRGLDGLAAGATNFVPDNSSASI